MRKYNWRPDRPDHRDFAFKAIPQIQPPPAFIDLSSQCPPVVDQGDEGSCTANAAAGARGFLQGKAGLCFVPLSRQFIYWYERFLDGDVNQDAGSSLRTAVKVLHKFGVCMEVDWPYVPKNFLRQPAKKQVLEAVSNRISEYRRVDHHSIGNIEAAIAEGFPILFGFTVFESFESNVVASTGLMPMPSKDDSAVGGHAVLAVGYDRAKKILKVRNSWGKDWGDHGYFYMPYEYVESRLTSDWWTIHH